MASRQSQVAGTDLKKISKEKTAGSLLPKSPQDESRDQTVFHPNSAPGRLCLGVKRPPMVTAHYSQTSAGSVCFLGSQGFHLHCSSTEFKFSEPTEASERRVHCLIQEKESAKRNRGEGETFREIKRKNNPLCLASLLEFFKFWRFML